jgi:cytochrome c553
MKRKLGWLLTGMLAVIALIAVAGGAILMRTHGLTTREAPGPLERWVARRARQMALPKGAGDRANPVADSPAVLADARAHWADHCAACHANNGSGEIELGKRLYPPAPDMRLDATQRMSDGELFYIIQNGIRLTGMPGWGGGGSAKAAAHGEEDSWKLVRFIRHLPQLKPGEEREMQGLNPKSPDELKEEQEERDFLNGGSPDEHAEHHHH